MLSFNLALWLEGVRVTFNSKSFRVSLLKGLFIAALLAANTLSGQQMQLFGSRFITTGTLAYVITFTITDTLAEVLGRDHASRLIWSGLAAQILFLLLLQLGVLLAPLSINSPINFYYAIVCGNLNRFVLASMLAYIVSQRLDISLFLFWKKFMKGHYLWFRNNASTILSQMVDTFIFVIIAYTGVFSLSEIFIIFTTQWVVKIFLSLLDTPFVYLLVSFIKRGTDSYTPGRVLNSYK